MHEILQPEGWSKPVGYANGVAARGRAIYVGGQIGWTGQAGVENVLDILRGGIDACLLGLGKSSIAELSADDIVVPPDFFLTLGDK